MHVLKLLHSVFPDNAVQVEHQGFPALKAALGTIFLLYIIKSKMFVFVYILCFLFPHRCHMQLCGGGGGCEETHKERHLVYRH